MGDDIAAETLPRNRASLLHLVDWDEMIKG